MFKYNIIIHSITITHFYWSWPKSHKYAKTKWVAIYSTITPLCLLLLPLYHKVNPIKITTVIFSFNVYLFNWNMHYTTLAIIVNMKKWDAQYECNLPFIWPVSIVAVEYISNIAAIIPIKDTMPCAIIF